MPQDTPPVLSSGLSSPISVLSESLSFHASPHAFLHQRGQSTGTQQKCHTHAVAARILNRKVAILASNRQCVDILSAGAETKHRSPKYTQGRRRTCRCHYVCRAACLSPAHGGFFPSFQFTATPAPSSRDEAPSMGRSYGQCPQELRTISSTHYRNRAVQMDRWDAN